MTDQHPSLSDRRLKTAETLSRLDDARTARRMAWIFFWVLIGLFVIDSGLLVYSALSRNGNKLTKVIMLGFDGLFGTLMTRVAWTLFPTSGRNKDGIS